jgi:two-component system, NtrC family, sensor kinase
VKLARKILAPVVLLLIVIVGLSTVLAVTDESAIFETDLHNDHLTLGGAVAAAVETAGSDGALRERVLRAVVAREAASRQGEPPLRVEIAPIPEGVAPFATVLRGGRFETYIPIGDRGSAIRVSESKRDLDELQARTLRRWLTTGTILGLVSAAVVLIGGSWFLGRPISRLAAFARRVGAGDLDSREQWSGNDELSELGREMSSMCRDLAAAKQRVSDEAEKRLAAVHALRHADRLGTVGQLAAGVAHELGTPLNVVQGRAQLVLEDTSADPETHNSANVIVDQVVKMTRIIRQLLDFARTKSGDEIRSTPYVVAQKTLDLLRAMAKKEDIELALESDPDARDAAATINEGLLAQVLANLIVNAIHASAGRAKVVSVRVGTRWAAPPIGGEAQRCVSVTVVDSGSGIDPSHIDHLFEPFFTTKEVGKGTGLGLSVSYGIVRDAGGWLEVASELGRGATFTVMLPALVADGTRDAFEVVGGHHDHTAIALAGA